MKYYPYLILLLFNKFQISSYSYMLISRQFKESENKSFLNNKTIAIALHHQILNCINSIRKSKSRKKNSNYFKKRSNSVLKCLIEIQIFDTFHSLILKIALRYLALKNVKWKMLKKSLKKAISGV